MSCLLNLKDIQHIFLVTKTKHNFCLFTRKLHRLPFKCLSHFVYFLKKFFNVCFTADLLEKVGELVEKLFDLDEELMKGWITAQPSEEEDEEDGENSLDVASCLLEAAKQLRWESEIESVDNVTEFV